MLFYIHPRPTLTISSNAVQRQATSQADASQQWQKVSFLRSFVLPPFQRQSLAGRYYLCVPGDRYQESIKVHFNLSAGFGCALFQSDRSVEYKSATKAVSVYTEVSQSFQLKSAGNYKA